MCNSRSGVFRQKRLAQMTDEERSAFLKHELARRREYLESNPDAAEKRKQQRREYLATPEVRERNKRNRLRRYRELSEQQKRKLFDVINVCRARGARRRRDSERWQSDPSYKIGMAIRTRLHTALRKQSATKKRGQMELLLGCSIDALKDRLESLFQPGMNWGNWSRYGWHIDHIKPLAKFDLTDPQQLAEACHYTNLQPLWAADNIRKRDRYPEAA